GVTELMPPPVPPGLCWPPRLSQACSPVNFSFSNNSSVPPQPSTKGSAEGRPILACRCLLGSSPSPNAPASPVAAQEVMPTSVPTANSQLSTARSRALHDHSGAPMLIDSTLGW